MTAPAPRRLLVGLLAPVAAFAATLALLNAVQGGGGAAVPRPSPVSDDFAALRSGGGSLEELQSAARAHPSDAAAYTDLGNAYLQRARETSDPAFYTRAEDSYATAQRLSPANADAVIGLGTIALGRHDFARGLELGRQAVALAPTSPRPLGVVADAQIELGRYRDARQTLDRFVSLKPNLASYARISYFRELHGDLRGASRAMALAASAGAGSPENVAYVQTLLGNLELTRGRLDAAQDAYRTALAGVPAYIPARAGLARLDVAHGNFDSAISRYRRIVAVRPLPEYAVALGDAQLVAGRSAAAQRSFDLVRVQAQLLRAAGVNVDAELAIFEADHGDRAEAVRLGQRALAAAPSVRSEDALGWALTRGGRPAAGLAHARRALRLGSVDPAFLYHAGMAARAAGRAQLGEHWLRRALERHSALSPYYARQAEEALR